MDVNKQLPPDRIPVRVGCDTGVLCCNLNFDVALLNVWVFKLPANFRSTCFITT